MSEPKPDMKKWSTPGLGLLVKLGSLVIHAQEAFDPGGLEYDRKVFLDLLEDADVKEWLENGTRLAFLPLIRRTK